MADGIILLVVAYTFVLHLRTNGGSKLAEPLVLGTQLFFSERNTETHVLFYRLFLFLEFCDSNSFRDRHQT